LNARRDRISVTELLTHRSAMPPTPLPVPEPRLGNLAEVIEAICRMDAIGEPGAVIDYSPAINHALLGEMVRRVRTVKTFREVVEERVWRPLKMADTALGAPAEWSSRLVPIRAKFSQAGWLTGADIEEMNRTLSPEAEMPWVGAVSTAADVFRFAEMLRRGGEREGARVLSTAVLDRALTNHTGDALNNWWIPMAQRMNWPPMPANLGLGFFLRGAGLHPSILGTLTSAGTFGNYGAGSTLYWVDPARELTFVCLTSGVLEESQNILRFQRLSDLAVSAVVRVNEGA
jgi:CubicO group peptidase (beta-lactamase class C family)